MKPFWLTLFFVLDLVGSGLGLTFPPAHSEGESIAEAAVSVGLYLTSTASKELGVSQLQAFFGTGDDQDPPQQPENPKTLAVALASGLRNKLDDVQTHLNRTTSRIFASLNATAKQVDRHSILSLLVTPVTQCCSSKRRTVGSLCDASTDQDSKVEVLTTIRDTFDENRRRSSLFGRQFIFGDSGKIHAESPSVDLCATAINDALAFRRRQISTTTLHPQRKNVLILLERGADQSAHELSLGRSVALFLSKLLSSSDQIGVVTLSNVPELVEPDINKKCSIDKLLPVSMSTKSFIERHLNRIHHTNDVSKVDVISGFMAALKMVEKSNLEKSESVQVMFISPFKNLNEGTWTKIQNLLTHYEQQSQLTIDVKSYHLLDSNQDSFAVPFLDNSTDYVNIHSTFDLSEKIGDPFDTDSESEQPSHFKIFPIYRNPFGNQDIYVTLAQNVVSRNVVIGVDILYEIFFQDFVFFAPTIRDESVRISLLEVSTGQLVFHPHLYDRVNGKAGPELGQLTFGQLESEKVYRQISDTSSGNLTFDNTTYTWQRVEDSPYAVVVMTSLAETSTKNDFNNFDGISDNNLHKLVALSATSKLPRIFFHRLDVLSPKMQSKLCRHFVAPATLETGSLLLSSDAFYEPWDQPKVVRSQNVESYMAYLTDKTSMISNPGIRPGVREDVLKIAQITGAWKNMSYDSGLNNYIVRRYAATSRGVYYVYPGTPSSADFEPSRQEWFMKAEKFPNLVVTTLPRLDPGGGGYIVSLSEAILNRGKVSGGVVGMDLTLGYVYKLVLNTSPLCHDVTVRCFLFDDEGYLVVHPDMFLVGEVVERQHLTYKEPLVAGDILRHSDIANKRKCQRHNDGTVQRFYSFNISYELVLTNVLKDGGVGGEGACSKYRVSGVHGTNLFLGIVETDDNCTTTAAAFCPCSVEDRWCILCYEKKNDLDDENTCECPCQCNLEQDLCPTSKPAKQVTEPVCPPEVQLDITPPSREVLMTSLPLPPCFERDCGRRTSKESCFGVIGCSWCEKEAQSGSGKLVELPSPYCGEMSRCFYGILGAKSPYDALHRRKDEAHLNGGRSLLRDSSQTSNDDFFFGHPTSSVGPIAGGIVGCIVFLALSVCLLRGQQKCSIVNTLAGAGNGNDSSLHVSNLEEEVEDDEERGEEMHEIASHAAILRVAPTQTVSPYQMNPSYRRPPPGTDSDHGYSTMTPLGGDIDSEIVPYTDSASARERLRKRPNMPPSSLHSVTSGVSSRTASPIHIAVVRPAESSALLSDTSEDGTPLHLRSDQPQRSEETQLGKHQFIVSATVHMEAH